MLIHFGMFASVRRLLFVAVALAIAFSFGGGPGRSAGMDMAMGSAAAAMPDGCNGCPGEAPDKMSLSECALFCGGAFNSVFPAPPLVTSEASPHPEVLQDRALAGQPAEPEPYPPR